jgi:hypothetical protein
LGADLCEAAHGRGAGQVAGFAFELGVDPDGADVVLVQQGAQDAGWVALWEQAFVIRP